MLLGHPFEKCFQPVVMVTRAGLLVVAGAIALSAGLAPSALRYWQTAQQEARAEAARASLAAEKSAQVQALGSQRAAILQEMRQLQAGDKHQDAIALASRFRLAEDAELHSLYQASANLLSFRQTLERMRALTAAQCTSDNAVSAAREVIGENYPSLAATEITGWTAVSLPAATVLPSIQRQVREIGSSSPAGDHDHRVSSAARTWSPAALHREHPVRPHPAVVSQLLDNAAAELYLCAWRVRGAAGSASNRFELDLWMTPAANERMLDYGLLGPGRAVTSR